MQAQTTQTLKFRDQGMDNDRLMNLREKLKAAGLSFQGAARKISMEDWAKVSAAGREWAAETGTPVNQAITMACRCYWELWEARKR